MRIHSVSGKSVNCGPCALSALIGVPTSTWPDRGMSALEFERIASEAGAVRLSDADFAIGRKLGAFGNRLYTNVRVVSTTGHG